MIQTQVVTISFFKYKGLQDKWWAFTRMGMNPLNNAQIEGLQIQKLLGSGAKNGFGIKPNFGVYGLLCVWDNEEKAKAFFKSNDVFKQFKKHSLENWTVYMQTTMAHGAWDGVSPFETTLSSKKDVLIGVITRARIYSKHLWHFWKFVPAVSQSIENREGLVFSIGIGELPLIQQATFSLWKNNEFMKAYAYNSKYHKEVIQKTRELGWYKEELFARFEPFDSEGTWDGAYLLKDYL